MSHHALATAAALAALAGPAAHAQNATAPETTLGTIEVTGSRLKRTDTETASPLQVIGREEIARSGATSLGAVLQRLPSNSGGTFNEVDTANTYGAAGVSLRGLGASSTLVLIDGRRVAPFGFPSYGASMFVDVNQIPASVIERVEVLLDGASAIYGSDALAGVVNVILRRDYRGAEGTASIGQSTHGDATQREASLTVGSGRLASDGYNLFASFSHSHQDPVKASARWHSQSGDYRPFGLIDYRNAYAYPGNLYSIDNRTFLQPLAPCATIADADATAAGRCVYDPAQFKDIVVESRRDALFVAGAAALPGGFELFGDATAARTVFRGQSPSITSQVYSFTGTLPAPFIPLPVGHPQNPYPTEVALRTRFADQPLLATPTSDTQRVVVGVRHRDLARWDVESAVLWSHSRTRSAVTGVISDAALVDDVLDADGSARSTFRFGDPGANDPALMARLYPRFVDVGRTSSASIDLRGTREVFSLPGGAAQLALGGELRRERFETALDPRTAAGETTVLFGAQARGGRSISSAYAELSLPITRSLEASLAGRFDHYSDFGSTTNPKAGLKWKVLPGLAARVTYATGFRAPSLVETSQTPYTGGVPDVRDPLTCPVPDPDNPNCDLFVSARFGGNPQLKPERATSTTAGIVVEPWRDASFTIDAFRIRRRDQINLIDPAYLLAHESQYPGAVVRAADGTIESLDLRTTNIGSGKVWGIDVSARASRVVAGLGRIGVDGSYEWLPHYWQAAAPEAPEADYAGTYVQPKSRARVVLSLDRAAWKSSLAVNYTSGYGRNVSPLDPSCPYDASGTDRPELCRVKSWRTLDLFVGYTGIANLELGLAVTNLDNVQAPFDERQVSGGGYAAYQSAFHSAVGRFFKLTAKYTFR